ALLRLPAAADPCRRVRGGPPLLPRLGRPELGVLDHRADRRGPRAARAARHQAGQVDARHAAHRPGDEGAAGEVQGRQAASQSRDDGDVQAAPGQPVRVLPAAHRADAGLHLAVLPAARGPQDGHLRAVHPGGGQPRRRGVRPGHAGLRGLLLHPGPHGGRHGRRARGAHPHVHRLAAALEPADDERDGRQDPALHHARAAVRLHGLHPELPGRPDRLLDHHEPVDRRPAVHHPQDHRPARQAAAGPGAGPRRALPAGDGQGGAGPGGCGQRRRWRRAAWRQGRRGLDRGGRRVERRRRARLRVDGRGLATSRAATAVPAQEEAQDRPAAL
ncbi:MAG: Inner membrane protein translocase and chaperone YidC, long form, partial [uncultured Solirubrobacteraceae bacterium]